MRSSQIVAAFGGRRDSIALASAPGLVGLWQSDKGITLVDNLVAALGDQSGFDHHALQADPAQQVNYFASGGPQGLPYLRFTSNRNLRAALTAALKPAVVTAYWDVRVNTDIPFNSVFNTSDSVSWQRGYGAVKRGASGYSIGGWVDKYNITGVDATLSASTWALMAMRYDGTHFSTWLNGVMVGAVEFAGPIVHGSGPLAIGASFVSAGVYQYSLEGDFTDLAICNVAHSDSTMRKVFKGLSKRTGITLA